MTVEEIARRRTFVKQLIEEKGQAEAIKECETFIALANANILHMPSYNSALIDHYEEQVKYWNLVKEMILHNV